MLISFKILGKKNGERNVSCYFKHCIHCVYRLVKSFGHSVVRFQKLKIDFFSAIIIIWKIFWEHKLVRQYNYSDNWMQVCGFWSSNSLLENKLMLRRQHGRFSLKFCFVCMPAIQRRVRKTNCLQLWLVPISAAGLETSIASVSAQIAPGVVALSTLGGHEFQFSCVQSLMCSQVPKLVERLLTETTLVSLFACVDFLVRF